MKEAEREKGVEENRYPKTSTGYEVRNRERQKSKKKAPTLALAKFIEEGKKRYTKAELKKIQEENRQDAQRIINRLKAQGVEI